MPAEPLDNSDLILAAEDFDSAEFEKYHRFAKSDERIISKLVAHGPVLLRGGRGSGKSALMLEAERRISRDPNFQALGIYISLRHLELIRSSGKDYEVFLCRLLLNRVQEKVGRSLDVSPEPTVTDVQRVLSSLSSELSKRIVLLFDDAAHIGREASLAEFFDVFRTISSSTVSCKAAIYPGVTKFGNRFDIFNDATVLDLARSDELQGHAEFFAGIMSIRYGNELPDDAFRGSLSRQDVAGFAGMAVLGNMRSFIFACNELAKISQQKPIGLPELNQALLNLASNYYWPLLEEVEPKLGRYAPMVSVAREAAEILFEVGGKVGNRSALVFREVAERIAKPLEILEYAGFISKRDVSRAMKSGGRGARYVLNLCNLLERTPTARLTAELYKKWTLEITEPLEFHRGSKLQLVKLPTEEGPEQLGVFNLSIEKLAKSQAYPYGLTDAKIDVLRAAKFTTIGGLASASDAQLDALYGVGPAAVQRIKNVVGQAIWM
jgi:hypothetical protein